MTLNNVYFFFFNLSSLQKGKEVRYCMCQREAVLRPILETFLMIFDKYKTIKNESTICTTVTFTTQ